jgi:membrane-bound serine protease (ClpP class)
MGYLVWAAVLLVIAVVFVVCELFVPSAGVLAFLAAASLVAAVVCAFLDSAAAGMVFVLLTVFGTPALLVVLFRWWPHTPIGRKMMPTLPDPDDMKPDNERLRALQELVGKTGTATTMMLPSGAVDFDGRVVNAVSDGLAIDEGAAVRVIKVAGSRVVVRAVDRTIPDDAEDDGTGSQSPLDRPIDSLGLDPYDDPLA